VNQAGEWDDLGGRSEDDTGAAGRAGVVTLAEEAVESGLGGFR
jgi:hypothetical protein